MKQFTENRKIVFWIGVGAKKGSNFVFETLFKTKKEAEKVSKNFGWKIIKIEINKI